MALSGLYIILFGEYAMAYLLQLLNSTFALIAFLFYLGFLKLKPQYREKKNSLMFYFFLGSGIIQIGNFFNQNYYVIVTLLYFTYQIYFMVKYFEGDFFFKMFVFFINKIMDILVMALWERFLVMAI
ncbi:MAG: hypothetical protein GX061_08880, partial [Eubacteriaceae bacterium]|nr:hypothetical protein [Eubacteriaceae bacterium]